MTLESQQVYKIDNKTPKVEKNLFARVNRFDQPIKTWDKMFLKLGMVDFTGNGLRIADCGLRITDYGLRIADCGLRITGYGLRITDCGLRIAVYGLRIADCEPMQIVYFFGKKPQELPVATCSYAMPPRKWLYMSWC